MNFNVFLPWSSIAIGQRSAETWCILQNIHAWASHTTLFDVMRNLKMRVELRICRIAIPWLGRKPVIQCVHPPISGRWCYRLVPQGVSSWPQWTWTLMLLSASGDALFWHRESGFPVFKAFAGIMDARGLPSNLCTEVKWSLSANRSHF